ncbi:MAG: mechanosensitive ion channel family protein [Steroidobacteraceae bacterium]
MIIGHYLQFSSNPWLATALGALAAVLAGLALHGIFLPIVRRLLAFSVHASTVLQYIARPTRVLLPLFGLQLVWDAQGSALPGIPYLRLLTAVLVTFVLTWTAIRAIAGFSEAVVRAHPANLTDNLAARRLQTQAHVLARVVMMIVLIIGIACALMLFPSIREVGAGLLASAGIAGIAAGVAARPVLSNLIAGLQLAFSQPIRLDDVVIIEGEWGRVEEITSTYVVVKIWDERRMVVPLQWIIENPFQNWTRTSAELLGTVLLWVDFQVPLAPLRAELERICAEAPEWDHRLVQLQVVDASERAMQIRALVSAVDSSKAWSLRCRVREGLIEYLQRHHPEGLPRLRTDLTSRRSSPEPRATR